MRRRFRIRKVLFWGVLFVGSVLLGAVGFAYSYFTDSDTLAALIRREAPRYLPTSRVRVDRVLLRPMVGDLKLQQTTVWQSVDGDWFPTLTIPWIHIRSEGGLLAWGKVAPREVIVAQPVLRMRRAKDGSWNLQNLLANPWPQANLPLPALVISRGSLELVDGPKPTTVLHAVSLRAEPLPDGSYRFEGDAHSDLFEKVAIEGTFHPKTGKLVLRKGDLTGLAINDVLRNRIPPEVRPAFDQLGLKRGECDLSVRLDRDPKASPRVKYEVGLTLHEGEIHCPKLPFPLSGVSASVAVTNDRITIASAEGRNGKTVVRLRDSRLSAVDTANAPMVVNIEAENLELDERLRAKTPEKLIKLWSDFSPKGRTTLNLGTVNVPKLRASRAVAGAQIRYDMDVDVQDVAIEYFQFPYPLEHIHGTLSWEGPRVKVNLGTVVGRKPLRAKGTIDNPGPLAEVDLEFKAGDMPIDEALFRALRSLPPEAYKTVQEFHAEGSVRGTASLKRIPDVNGDPKGKVRVDADLYLNPGCAIRWDGLPYPVRNLTGRLELHPTSWIFTDMKGENGLARIEASGKVEARLKDKKQLDVDVALRATHLPFDGQLRQALPKEWQKTWTLLDPHGSSTVNAKIALRPGIPGDYKFRIVPEPNTSVHLTFTPLPSTENPGPRGLIDLPIMQDVTGTFLFDNGLVNMLDVRFGFHQAPVRFGSGRVKLEDASGKFKLHVDDLNVEKLRLDSELRKVMPPLMSQFARRLDDGKTFRAKGNLDIAWSGRGDDPAVCSWDHATVIFNDNTIATGLPIEHIHGEIRDIAGKSDGRSLGVTGVMDIDSVSIHGQHLNNLESPLVVADGKASLTSIQGQFLGGILHGEGAVTLDTTPRYAARLSLTDASLKQYAMAVPGHQDFKGEVWANVEFSGLGQDLKTVQGNGEAHVAKGDLAKLPILNQIKKLVGSDAHAVFDAADVTFTLGNGQANLDPIKITSNALSLQGAGTIDQSYVLNIDLKLLPGRNERFRLPFLPDLGAQLFALHVSGAIGASRVTPSVIPLLTKRPVEAIKKFDARRAERSETR